jgi:hypothetical protein
MHVRVVAIATTLAFVAVGLLAQRHEAEAAHAREQSGRIVHAQALADHHETSPNTHLHKRDAHGHAGDCSLLTMAHERLVSSSHTPIVVATEAVALVEVAASHDVASPIATYRLAPKTSPPSA